MTEVGSEPCLEAVRFRPGPAAGSACPLWFRSGPMGAPDCRGWAFRLGSVRVSRGARPSSLLWDWHRVLRFVIARDGGRGYVWPVIRCSGGDGLTCREPTPQIVADVSPW